MMDRKKLVIEKYLDGELEFRGVGNDPDRIAKSGMAFIGSRAVQKFVVDELEMLDAGDEVAKKDGLGELAKAPYPWFWVEERIHRADGGPERNACMAVNAFPYDTFLSVYKGGCATRIFSTDGFEDFAKEHGVLAVLCFMQNAGGLYSLPFRLIVPQGQVGGFLIERLVAGAEGEAEVKHMANEFRATLSTLLVMLGTKNGCSGETVTPDEGLQKARSRRGKPQLFTYVRLTPNIGTGRRPNPEGGTTPHKAHMVRGHFKKRETGTYWWGHHARGVGEVQERKAYVVKPNANVLDSL